MNNWTKLTIEEKLTILSNVAESKGIVDNAVEKDYWVSMVLRAIFTLPYATAFVFPRGTIHRLIPLNKFKAIIPLIIFNGYPILYQSLVFLNLQHYQPLSSVYVSPSSLVGIGCKFNHAEKALSFSSLLTFRMPSLMYSAIRGRTSYSILFFNSSSSEAMK